MVIFKRDGNGEPIFHKSFTLDWDKEKKEENDEDQGPKDNEKIKKKDKKDDDDDEKKDDEWTVSNFRRVEMNKMIQQHTGHVLAEERKGTLANVGAPQGLLYG